MCIQNVLVEGGGGIEKFQIYCQSLPVYKLLTIPENLIFTCFLRMILIWKFENLLWKKYGYFSD